MTWLIAAMTALVPFADRLGGTVRAGEALLVATVIMVTGRRMPLSTLVPFFVVVVLSGVFVYAGVDDLDRAARQAGAMMSSGLYVSLVLAHHRPHHVAALMRAIAVLATFNAIVIVVAGFFPGLVDLVVTESSRAGRHIAAGVQLPFVRNAGLLNHYGYNAAFMILGLYCLVKLSAGTPRRRLVGAAIVLILFSFLVTQSRVSWIIVMVFGYFMIFRAWLASRGWWRILYTAVLGGSIVVGLIVAYPVLDWLISIKARTFYGRLEQVAIGLSLFSESPVFGAGYGAYFRDNPTYVLHNGWVTLLYSTGLTGFVLFGLVFFYPLAASRDWRTRAEVAFLLFAGALVMSGASGLSYFSVWLLVGFCYILALERHRPRGADPPVPKRPPGPVPAG